MLWPNGGTKNDACTIACNQSSARVSATRSTARAVSPSAPRSLTRSVACVQQLNAMIAFKRQTERECNDSPNIIAESRMYRTEAEGVWDKGEEGKFEEKRKKRRMK